VELTLRLLTVLLLLLVLMTSSGCGTIITNAHKPYSGTQFNIAVIAVWSAGGLDIGSGRLDISGFAAMLSLIDFPMSFVMDTVLLPISALNMILTGRSEG
jgi:uncharacterized protein YceK